ncbi:Porphobilinogen deaminase [Polystyrenella longa]|uniref:Porphobilinogen deaminase n=1 Tax=Polystyrenella longa TaxID=2528007 RepID=A0A518CIL4_9PLAN|nr:hydroxymethylbilane synthase [Polystyrenella longa]QDU79062.1 Porphobilinogen deaminase [Polystyrenella longa]
MTASTIRIATRASQLALWQAEHVAALLRAAHPDLNVEIVHISTIGDRDQTEPLANMGGQGVFTREVQHALLDNRADVAVHSLKDLPTQSATDELFLAAIPAREEVADVLVLPADSDQQADLDSLPEGARIGTGSMRRQAQLLHYRPDFQVSSIRGNVETRLRKLDEGEYDAIVLAAAGLKRLKLENRISLKLGPPLMLAAVGQGALGLECRTSDQATRDYLAALNEPYTSAAATAERALLNELKAGCHAPVGTNSHLAEDSGQLMLEGVVLSTDGKQRLYGKATASMTDAEQLGRQLAQGLLDQGAAPLIDV